METKNKYIAILPFMTRDLCLTGADLLVYAYIYNLTKAFNQAFIARNTLIPYGIFPTELSQALRHLLADGYITKIVDENNEIISYKANILKEGEE